MGCIFSAVHRWKYPNPPYPGPNFVPQQGSKLVLLLQLMHPVEFCDQNLGNHPLYVSEGQEQLTGHIVGPPEILKRKEGFWALF